MSRIPSGGRSGERRLTKIYRSLEAEDRKTLLAFGEFLMDRGPAPDRGVRVPLDPENIPRPRKESVVAAIKRLSRSYHMLDRSAMLNETSSLMSAHVLQGRPSGAVIDELEALFVRYYEKYREELEKEEN